MTFGLRASTIRVPCVADPIRGCTDGSCTHPVMWLEPQLGSFRVL